MNYTIELSKDVKKILKKCDRHIVIHFFEKIKIMSINPFDSRLDIKKLQNSDDYRLRVGKFRFLYTIQENIILIYFYKADSRGDIYKN
ncbi:MAG TPA: type II toxin-antitoxin system RelE/ParE family toxin [Candidatus Absconditabacterales bacterium]|nr:type II toxin-antitoxin system RelE/ParE family toxin [Candidatus Absconditabacterales bacterium]HMT26860.1 type II toxin-antitoxin system RelE/ParE family toxin [Candidatus Absconditabacterales bacterium]